VQEMVLFKGYTKNSPQWTFLCQEPSIKKRIWKNFRGLLQPSYSPGSAYEIGTLEKISNYVTNRTSFTAASIASEGQKQTTKEMKRSVPARTKREWSKQGSHAVQPIVLSTTWTLLNAHALSTTTKT